MRVLVTDVLSLAARLLVAGLSDLVAVRDSHIEAFASQSATTTSVKSVGITV
jgi:hypothetical protein